MLAQQSSCAQRDYHWARAGRWSTRGTATRAARDRGSAALVASGARNPVVLTGDIHAHWASDLQARLRRPGLRRSAVELVTTSITSDGDGEDAPLQSNPWLEWNPHLRFQNNLRGYVRARITPTSLDADFRALRKVTRRDQQVFTRASVAIADQEPGVHLTADNPA